MSSGPASIHSSTRVSGRPVCAHVHKFSPVANRPRPGSGLRPGSWGDEVYNTHDIIMQMLSLFVYMLFCVQ